MDILKNNNDFHFVDGDLLPVTGSQESAQRVKERLQSFAYEFFLNDEGLPYFEEMLGKGVDPNRVESLIITVINKSYGVRRIEDLSLIYDTESRQTFVDSTYQTNFGDTISVRAVLPTVVPTEPQLNIIRDTLNEIMTDTRSESLLDLS